MIAKLKGIVRRMYNSWVISLVISQLKFKAAEQVTVPSDVPTCKTNLFKWLSAAVDELNKDGTGILQRRSSCARGRGPCRPRRLAGPRSSSQT